MALHFVPVLCFTCIVRVCLLLSRKSELYDKNRD